MRRKPYCVLLLDEIEKAHPDVFNMLLQLLDEGRLTDSHGRTVNFRNCVVIMTSNIASHVLLEGIERDGQIREDARRRVLESLRERFRPEFLNRVDEIVLFKPLTQAELERIVDLQIAELAGRLAEQRLAITVTPAARRFIAQRGYDPVYGARPLKRYIQQAVETPAARAMLAGDRGAGGTLKIDFKKDGLTVALD